MQSKSLEILKACDRETLEGIAFHAIALLRMMGKGELPAPPAKLDRTGLTISLLKIVQQQKEQEAWMQLLQVLQKEQEMLQSGALSSDDSEENAQEQQAEQEQVQEPEQEPDDANTEAPSENN